MSTPQKNPVDPTIGTLVKDVSRDLSALIQSEIALAKSEVRISVKSGGIGAGLLAASAILGLLLVIMLSISGYGPSGPYVKAPVYDQVIQAMAGVGTESASSDCICSCEPEPSSGSGPSNL